MKSTEVSSATYCDVFAALARQLLSAPPPEEQRLPLLNEVWKTVTKCEDKDILSYLRCCFAWLKALQRFVNCYSHMQQLTHY